VEDEDQVLGLQVAAYWRVVPGAGAKNVCAAKIDDVAACWIIRPSHMLTELCVCQIANHVIVRLVFWRATSASSSNVNPKKQMPVQQRPVPAKTAASVVAGSRRERKTLATLAGPHNERLDCQVS
jgi:hypothetical protein